MRFTWSEALDTAADVYHGVSASDTTHSQATSDVLLVRLLVHVD